MARLVMLAAALLTASRTGAAASSGPCEAVERYVQALIDGDPAAADSAWVAADLAHAHRLGIRYASDLPKQDNASPLFAWIPALRSGGCRLELQAASADDAAGRAVVRVRVVDTQVRAEAMYCAERVGAQWRVASPLRHSVEGWPRWEGRFIRLMAPDSSAFNGFVLSELDRQVERAARTLQLADSALVRLENGKFDWVLAGESEVTAMVGAPTQGVANLQFDAVITQERFHTHELAHLLVGLWLQQLPLYALPLLQEGLAVHLGGRWGKSTAVEEMLGAFVLASEMTTLDELLEAESFRSVPPDEAYAVAGLFCGFLLERLGPEALGELYRTLGGSQDDVQSLRHDAIADRIARAAANPWAALRQDFAEWWPTRQDTGIRPGCRSAESQVQTQAALPCFAGADRTAGEARLWVDRGHLQLVVQARQDAPRGALVMLSTVPLPSTSRRFAEQLPLAAYRGQRFGIVFDAEEVGLYDFGLDVLVAKFARALGGGGELWDPSTARLCVELDVRHLPDGIDLTRWVCVPR